MFAGDPLRNAAPALLDVVESALRLTLADGLQQICGQPVAKQALRRLQDALARLGEAT
jgi:4-hydroxy-L-threonine phosphate dehydrogenase PdxA